MIGHFTFQNSHHKKCNKPPLKMYHGNCKASEVYPTCRLNHYEYKNAQMILGYIKKDGQGLCRCV